VLGCGGQHHSHMVQASCLSCVHRPVYRNVQHWVLQCINDTICTEVLDSDMIGLLLLACNGNGVEMTAVFSCLDNLKMGLVWIVCWQHFDW
jgi:hypothetical protein